MGVSDNKVVELRQDYVMIYCVKSFLKQKVKKNSRNIVAVVKCMSDLLSYSYKHMVSWVKFPESKRCNCLFLQKYIQSKMDEFFY